MLTPLTDLVGQCGQTKVTIAKGTKKVPWHWDEVHQRAFDKVKSTIVQDVVLAYPDYSKPFDIYTDASATQLGAVITQNNRPLAFFSRKLSDTQKKYSVTEIELLAIVETLKEFKGMLWGQIIKVFTDHKNLIQDALGLTSDRVYRWRLIIEEYGPEIIYIKGINNTVADAISRLDFAPIAHSDLESDKKNWMNFAKCFCAVQSSQDQSKTEFTMDMNHVFANRSDEGDIYPLTVKEIAEEQLIDQVLQQQKVKLNYEETLIEDTYVLCKNGKLVIPKTLQRRAVQWYHHYLQHPGHTRLEETLRAAMYWKNLRKDVRLHVKTCKSCQVNKRKKQKFGKMPTKLVVNIPWEYLCVDLIGPYTIKGKDKSELDFMCLTMIDPATSWFEMVELPVEDIVPTTEKTKKAKEAYFDKSSLMVSNLVNKCWFCRYPRCRNIIFDNGSEFKLHFKRLCKEFGVKPKPTTIKNPQANAILERIHLVVMTMICTAEIDMADSVATSDIDTLLTNVSWAIRSTYHTVLKASPGAAIFGRDMLFDIPFIADWKKIGDFRQRQTDLNTMRENKKRTDFDYKVGDKILIVKEKGKLRKAESPKQKEPWTIKQVHTNGTIRVKRGNKTEQLNVQRVEPFYEK